MFQRETRIWVMLFINASFFLAEIVVGYYVRSLALIADSFHMLSDMLSLAVALWAIKLAARSRHDPKYSYGWQRAEILGALVNAVFLLALCVMIVIEAIQRFVMPETITNPMIVVIMGCAGLAGNLVGLFLFHEHGHHHHHHHHEEENPSNEKHEKKHSHGHMNMKGIFLHVMGDALGNIGVIVSGLVIWLTPYDWRFYFDPIISIVISAIIFASAVPLVKATSFILLQGVPHGVPLDDVRHGLSSVEGVLSVHELHIWQLSDTKSIASLHVRLQSQTDYKQVSYHIRQILHCHGIHSVTIQPEFVDTSKLSSLGGSESHSEYPSPEEENEATCLLRCTDDSCVENLCCPSPPHPL